MAEYYLEFEKPLRNIDNQILELETGEDPSANRAKIDELKEQRERELKKVYSGLSRWQKVQLARHPRRPYCLDYINFMAPNFIELHGDRYFSDDSATVGGLGSIDGQNVMFIGQQKGRNTNENIYRNFGMMRPEGYRKALRVMKLAEKFNIPIISLIDTMGAYPGIGAEERGQGEAIARNLFEMSQISVRILIIVIGEGASGGALGIGVGDRFLMLENTWFSVISPEGCASILWREAAKAPDAADAMKVTAVDMVEMGICDRIIEEPLGGAHRDHTGMAEILKEVILDELSQLNQLETSELLDRRLKRFDDIGTFTE